MLSKQDKSQIVIASVDEEITKSTQLRGLFAVVHKVVQNHTTRAIVAT